MAEESIGTLFPTKIPGYTDPADIQAALRAYHYGSYDFNTAETEPTNLLTPSIARTLYELQQSIANVDISSAIAKSVFAAKGDLISASANDTPEILNSSLAGNGKILTTNSATATGLEWTDVLPSLSITLSTASSVVNGRIFWDSTNKKIQVGDGTTSLDFASSNLVANTKTASYTTVITDKDKVLEMNVASANNLTIPLNSAVPYPIGTQINILQVGAGQTTVVPAGGVTINATPGLKLRAQWSAATLAKRAENTWVLIGDLIA